MPARTNCQAKYLETTPTYTFAKWPGVAGTSATGTIQISAQSPANSPAASPSALSITGITVNGVSIIPATPAPALTITDTTSSTQRNTLAANIVTAINANSGTSGFSATRVNDLVTIAQVVPSTFTGVVAVTTSTNVSAAGAKAVGSITFTRARNSGTLSSIRVNTNNNTGPLVTIMNTHGDGNFFWVR